MTRPHFRFPAVLAMAVIGQLAFAESTHQEHIHGDDLEERLDARDAELKSMIFDVGNALGARIGGVEAELREKLPLLLERTRRPASVDTPIAPTPAARRTLAVTLAGDNADGCDIPTVTLAYEHESDMIDAHGRATTQGNLACNDATSADVQIRAALDRVALTLGYDRRAVAVQEVVAGEGRVVRYGASTVETAAIGYAVGESVTVGWNVLQEAPRVALEHDFAHGVTVEAEAQRYPATGFVGSFRVSWTHELREGWSVTAHVGMTHGLDNVPDGIRWADVSADGPAQPIAELRHRLLAEHLTMSGRLPFMWNALSGRACSLPCSPAAPSWPRPS